jgi:putative DNA primase/helicase
MPNGFAYSFFNGVYRLAKISASVSIPPMDKHLVPFRNGILSLTDMKISPHDPSNYCTWTLPYNYDEKATCKPVITWAKEAMNGDDDKVELLRAYTKAVITGRVDFQRFLEIIGPGGTGKGTFQRLMMALVGYHNVAVTELKHLETNRFETATIFGKRLILITDSERWGGSVATLKAITGQDALRWEEKNVRKRITFTAEGLVVVAANEPIQSTDYTSGLERRRITIPFIVHPKQPRRLMEIDGGVPSGEFLPYLPGVINWALEMPEASMEATLRGGDALAPSLRSDWINTLLKTNSIADWANTRLIYDTSKDTQTQVGIAKPLERGPGYESELIWLYPNYRAYAEATGSKPIAMRRFGDLLEDLLVSQLKLPGISRHRDSHASHFKGIRFRKESDEKTPGIVDITLKTGSQCGEPDQSPPCESLKSLNRKDNLSMVDNNGSMVDEWRHKSLNGKDEGKMVDDSVCENKNTFLANEICDHPHHPPFSVYSSESNTSGAIDPPQSNFLPPQDGDRTSDLFDTTLTCSKCNGTNFKFGAEAATCQGCNWMAYVGI